MPLYEYLCDACAHRFEIIQKFSDPPADSCPQCGGAVRKLLSSPAIQFKGSGWYITDYARAGKGGGSTSKKDGSSSPEPKPDAKAETKSEGKGDAKPASASASDAG